MIKTGIIKYHGLSNEMGKIDTIQELSDLEHQLKVMNKVVGPKDYGEKVALDSFKKEIKRLRKASKGDEPKNITVEERFWQLCLNLKIEIIYNEEKGRMIFTRDDKYIFEFDVENKYLWCSWVDVWLKLENEYLLDFRDIQNVIKKAVEKQFKRKGITVSYFWTNFDGLGKMYYFGLSKKPKTGY